MAYFVFTNGPCTITVEQALEKLLSAATGTDFEEPRVT